MDLQINYKKTQNKEILKNLIYFLIIFIAVFFYQLKIIRNDEVGIFTNILCLILFLISIYNIKIALYFFIYLMPLLNFIPYIFGVSYYPIILFLFFSLFLGFIINKSINYDLEISKNKFLFLNNKIKLVIFIIFIILCISIIFEIFRYSNFFPFFTQHYYNLNVNINGLKSNDAIIIVIGFFFNYVSGLAFLFLIFSIIDNFEDIKDIVKTIALSTYFYFIIIIIQRFFNPRFGNFEPWISSARLNGTFTDPNSLGSYTVLILPIIFAAIFYYKKWYFKLFLCFSFIIVFFSLLLSGSRSALVGILISVFIFLIYGLIKFIKIVKYTRKYKKIIYIISLILVIIIILSSILFVFGTNNKIKSHLKSSSIVSRLNETIQTAISSYKRDGLIESIKSISNYRYILWQRAFQMGKDYIITGVGVGAYIIELPDYHWRYNRGFLQVDYPGNYYLQLFSELGIVGLFLFLFLFYLVLKESLIFLKRKENNEKKEFTNNDILYLGLFASFLSMILILIFGSHTNNIEVQFFFWMIIGLLLIIPIIIKEKKQISLIKLSNGNKLLLKNGNYSGIIIKNNLRNENFLGITLTQKFLISLIILIFAGNFLWSSYSNLSIFIKQDKSGWVDVKTSNSFGFYSPEDGSRNGPRFTNKEAGLSLKKEGEFLTFALKAKNPDINTNPLYVKIFIDYKLLTQIKLNDSNWHKLTINLKDNHFRYVTVTLINSRTWVPKQFDKTSNDSRQLGVMISSFEFLK